jgi:hypothetical protein
MRNTLIVHALAAAVDDERFDRPPQSLAELSRFEEKHGNIVAVGVMEPEVPVRTEVQSAAAVSPDREIRADAPSCKACGGNRFAIEFGKFGSYFKCNACEANTALKIGCEVPEHEERTRKSKLVGFDICVAVLVVFYAM